MDWQLIEFAPKDGTEIILGTKLSWDRINLDKHECRVGVGFYCAGAFWYEKDKKIWKNRLGQHMVNPSYFMELPQNPVGIYNLEGTVAGGEAYSLDRIDTITSTKINEE